MNALHLLTDADVCDWLRVSARTLRRLLAASDEARIAVPAVGAGRGRRITHSVPPARDRPADSPPHFP